jgi:hypothetical protein
MFGISCLLIGKKASLIKYSTNNKPKIKETMDGKTWNRNAIGEANTLNPKLISQNVAATNNPLVGILFFLALPRTIKQTKAPRKIKFIAPHIIG